MTDFLPPDADAGSEPRPDVPPPDAVTAGSRPEACRRRPIRRPDPSPSDSPAGDPGAEAPGTVPTEPVVPTRTGPRQPRRRPSSRWGISPRPSWGRCSSAEASSRSAASAVPSPRRRRRRRRPRTSRTDRRSERPPAPVTIEIWADYQCPFCRLEAMVFGGSMERAYVLPGTARIVYHDFAFLGQESIDAAVAARCAGRQDPGAYWRYHDLLFASQQGENQGAFSRANLVTLAGIASLDATAFSGLPGRSGHCKGSRRRDGTGPRARHRVHPDPAHHRPRRDANADRLQPELGSHQGRGRGRGVRSGLRQPRDRRQPRPRLVGGAGGDAVAAQLGAARSRRGKTHPPQPTATTKTAPRTSRSSGSKVPARIRVGSK